MKRLVIFFLILFVFSITAYAQMGMMGGQQGQMGQGMMGGGQQPIMNCPMQQTSGQGMMQGGQQMPMMQMMMDMMNMQEKMMMGAKGAEKKKMMEDLKEMKEKMQNMMSMRSGMMGQPSDVCPCKLNCAEQWLKKAIDLHEVHIKDPKTATEASQLEMMNHMKKAYECITGARCGMSGATSKESESKETEKEKTSKGDEHGH